MQRVSRRSLSACAALLMCCAIRGQEFRGNLSGVIVDPAGAVIPGAMVAATEVNTGTKVQTASDAAGQYNLPFLAPGDYDIAVQSSGFKEFVRRSVHVGAGDHPVVDIALEVGNATQTIEVTADAPLVNSENASIGQAITTKEVADLPLNGRTPLTLASLSMGVLATGQPSLIHPFDSGGAAGWSIAGTASQTNEIQVNGSPDATWEAAWPIAHPTMPWRRSASKPSIATRPSGTLEAALLTRFLKAEPICCTARLGNSTSRTRLSRTISSTTRRAWEIP